MAAVSGQSLANLTKGTLTKIHIDQSFDHFYANVARKSEGLLGEPTLPRKSSVLTRILPWGVPGPPLLRNRGPVRTLGGLSPHSKLSVT